MKRSVQPHLKLSVFEQKDLDDLDVMYEVRLLVFIFILKEGDKLLMPPLLLKLQIKNTVYKWLKVCYTD